LGGYRLTGRLGEGGQGIVYLGVAATGEQVAIKVLRTTDPQARARLARELNAARQVAPFCTAAVLDASMDGPTPYVVSEFVDGPSLEQRVSQRGPLRGGELDRLAVGTATALRAIHRAGIVHRDLKPANVLLGPDGPRVVDFGIARAIDANTHTAMVGTPAYFAPEWLHGHTPTPASDVFAWAATIVFAATGQPPFGTGPTVAAILHRVGTAPPDLSGIPPSLYELLSRCLDKDPRQRPAAQSLVDWLVEGGAPPVAPTPPTAHSLPPQGFLGGPPTAPPLAGYDPGPTVTGRRRSAKPALLVAALAAAVALGAAGTVLYLDDDAKDPDLKARTNTSENSTPVSSSTSPAAQSQASGTLPTAFDGTWSGSADQPSNGITKTQRFTVKLILDAKAGTGSSSLNDGQCPVNLTLTKVIDSNTVTMQEVLTDAAATCVAGTVKLTLKDGKLGYHGEATEELLSSTVVVDGTLSKQG
jgi:serine/threonine protein kinase